MKNLCSTCGKVNDQDAEFCDHCMTQLKSKLQGISAIDLEATMDFHQKMSKMETIKNQEKCAFCSAYSVTQCCFNYCCVRGCEKNVCLKHSYTTVRAGKSPVQCCKDCEARLIIGSWRMVYWTVALALILVVALVLTAEYTK